MEIDEALGVQRRVSDAGFVRPSDEEDTDRDTPEVCWKRGEGQAMPTQIHALPEQWERLAERIFLLRNRKDWTQQTLVTKTREYSRRGVSRASVIRSEKGEPVSRRTLVQLALALGVGEYSLLDPEKASNWPKDNSDLGPLADCNPDREPPLPQAKSRLDAINECWNSPTPYITQATLDENILCVTDLSRRRRDLDKNGLRTLGRLAVETLAAFWIYYPRPAARDMRELEKVVALVCHQLRDKDDAEIDYLQGRLQHNAWSEYGYRWGTPTTPLGKPYVEHALAQSRAALRAFSLRSSHQGAAGVENDRWISLQHRRIIRTLIKGGETYWREFERPTNSVFALAMDDARESIKKGSRCDWRTRAGFLNVLSLGQDVTGRRLRELTPRDSISLLDECLQIYRSELGDSHHLTAACMLRLAQLDRKFKGDLKNAVPVFNRWKVCATDIVDLEQCHQQFEAEFAKYMVQV